MIMKWYSTLPRDPELEPHLQMQFSVIPRILNPDEGASQKESLYLKGHLLENKYCDKNNQDEDTLRI